MQSKNTLCGKTAEMSPNPHRTESWKETVTNVRKGLPPVFQFGSAALETTVVLIFKYSRTDHISFWN